MKKLSLISGLIFVGILAVGCESMAIYMIEKDLKKAGFSQETIDASVKTRMQNETKPSQTEKNK